MSGRPNIMDNGIVRPMTNAEWTQYQTDMSHEAETEEVLT